MIKFLRRVMPFGFWAGLAFLAGIPFALAVMTAIEAVFWGFTGFPVFMVLYLSASWVLAWVFHLFPKLPNVGAFLSIASLLVALSYVGIKFSPVGAFDFGPIEEFPFNLSDFIWFCTIYVGSMLFLALPMLVVFSISIVRETPSFRRVFSFGKGGAARWAGPYSYANKSGHGAIYLGSTFVQDTFIKTDVGIPYEDDAHHVTIAASGAGKSITAIWPTLQRYQGPMVVLDPKGEHAAFSAVERRDCLILDPYNKTSSSDPEFSRFLTGYNPLSEIDIHDDRARALIQAIGSACVMEETGDNIHFSEAAKTILEGVIVHVMTHFPQEQQTLPQVADLFRGFDPDIGASDPQAFDDVIAAMTTNGAAGGLAMDAAGLLLNAADRERGSMLTTCFRSLKWVNDPPMRKHLSYGDRYVMRAVTRSTNKTTVYLVLPFEYMEKTSQIRWMRMLVNLLTVHLFRHPRDNSGQKKLLLVLDEFHKLGYMPSLEEGIVTARGAGMKYWILTQNIGHFKNLYGDNWETFLGSSNCQFFGVQDNDTARWVADAMGGDRDRESGQYQLMRPDEVRQFLGNDLPTQIVIPTTGAPMRLERKAFKRIKRYRGL